MLGAVLKRLLPRRLSLFRARFADVHALYEKGDLDRAERASRRIADAPPADVHFLQGLIAKKRGDMVRAALCMRAAVEARGDEPAFHLNLAEALFALGRYADALEHYDTVLASESLEGSARLSALRDAGRCHTKLGDMARGCEYFEEALAIAPDDLAVCNYLSTALHGEMRSEEGRAALEPLVRARGAGMRLRRALFLPAVYDNQAEIDSVRERFSRELDEVLERDEPHIADPAGQIAVTAFHLAYHNRNNAALLAKLCRAVRHIYPAAATSPSPARRRTGRLRVGFVSSFFHLHSVGRTTIGFIRDLPRDRFAVHVFAIDPRGDAMRQQIEKASDVYVKLARDFTSVRRALAEAELDVLVFADIGMEPLTYALALSRFAPVQAVSWGHSETSGLDTIDYYLSAAGVEIGSADAHYTERLIRPQAFFLGGYERPPLPPPMTRDELGLPDNARLYACLQPAFKLHPDIDPVFARLLERDEKAQILVMAPKPYPAARLRERFARTLGENAARIRLLPGMAQARYHATMRAADVALDPLYFGGCNSSAEAMAFGVPLVTLPGDHLHGRFTFGLYREMGLDTCVAKDVDDYVDIACRLAGDGDARAVVSRDILERSGVLYDRRDITLAYADFLDEAIRARVTD
jgi:protein O-GlcNAc transferase